MRNQTDFGTITGFGTLIAIIGFALIGPSEQRTDNNPKNDLTGKAPYRFESTSLQRGVARGRDGLLCRLAVPSGRPVGNRLCSLIVSAGYRWIKSQAWIPDFDTCEPLASLK